MPLIFYYTTWSPCYIHTSYEGCWKSIQMARHPYKREWVEIDLKEAEEFVFTDGQGHWDNPCQGQNYKNPGGSQIAVYRGSVIRIENAEPILLVSDLDNTLIGSHPDTKAALRRFNEYWISKHCFGHSRLVYNTGRSLEEFLNLYKDGQKLLDPDMLITAVGSDAYTIDIKSGAYVQHLDYHHLYDGEYWDSNIIDKIVREKFPWMVIPNKQHIYAFKIWVTALTEDVLFHRDYLKKFLKNSENEVREGKIIHARAIVSGSGDWRYIDITPRIGGKRIGVRYAQQFFKFPPNRTIVAGDSGNDIEMFRDPHFGVLVENADNEISSWFFKKNRLNKFKSQEKWGDGVIDGIQRTFYG